MREFVATVLVVGLMAVVVQAGAVHYSFDEKASGTWEVSVTVTGYDTAGLSAYSVWVNNTADVSYIENTLLYDSGTSTGFDPDWLFIGYSGVDYYADNSQWFSGGVILNIGMGNDSLGLGVPALLGTLTTPAGLGYDDEFEPREASLLNLDGDDDIPANEVTITHEVNPIPEPMTFSLLVDAS